MSEGIGAVLLEAARERREAYVGLLQELVRVESPTDDPASQRPIIQLLEAHLEELGFEVRHIPGRVTGGHLYARPRARRRGVPAQLLIGHTDTVWPTGTLAAMPLRREDGRLYGPGAFDMKAGLTSIIFALRILRDLELEPSVTPVVFVNSDEETGSGESRRWVRRLARLACRAWVAEPALGEEGHIKTARKGVGRFVIALRGKAAHSGLNPTEGASAILALSHVIQELHALGAGADGTTVNVGVVGGGTRANVVAAEARAWVDVRVAEAHRGIEIEEAIRAIRPKVEGVGIEVEGGLEVPPLERTPRNRRLWEMTRRVAGEMGCELSEAMVGGGSDGNTTSQFTATLDGIGAVGDGAHAVHEHVTIAPTIDRCALLARLILEPADDVG